MAALATSIPVKLVVGMGEAQYEIGEAQLPFDATVNPDSFTVSVDSPSIRTGLIELLRSAADQIEQDELGMRRLLKDS